MIVLVPNPAPSSSTKLHVYHVICNFTESTSSLWRQNLRRDSKGHCLILSTHIHLLFGYPSPADPTHCDYLMYVQGSDKSLQPGCVNAAGKLRQEW